MEHELKTWPRYFAAVASGYKRFEIRKADRPYAVGDTLVLREYDRDRGYLCGTVRVRVLYLMADTEFVPMGSVAMSIELL